MPSMRTQPGTPAEVELVLLLSNPLLDADSASRVRQLGAQLLDWNQVFGMLIMHRTAGLAWRNMLVHDLGKPADFKPEYVLPVIEVLAKGQALLAIEQAVQSSKIAQALEQAGIRNVVLKGSALAILGYGDLGLRISNDTDILVSRADLTKANHVMNGLSYIQGTWDIAQNLAIPACRREIAKYTLYSHQTFPYVKAMPYESMMERHQVDMHFSVDVGTSNDTDDAVADMLSRRISIEPIAGSPLWSVSPEDMFVFVCVNFAREARVRTETMELVDLVLYKVVDVLALLNSRSYPVTPERILDRVTELRMANEVYFALHHVAELFPAHTPEALLNALRPESTAYLDAVQDFASPDAPWHSWKSPVTERFFNTRRILELTD
jgi:Uncharacterised nucleotidyltransferase